MSEDRGQRIGDGNHRWTAAPGAGEVRDKGEAVPDARRVLSGTDPKTWLLMEQVVERANLEKALKAVRANKGSPGVDGMTIDGLVVYLKAHWPRIKEQLLADAYQPQPVKRGVYLNELDKGWNEKHASWGQLTRDADDFVIQCVSAKQAEVVKAKVVGIFRRLGLELHPEKTRIVDVREGGVDFLGHHLRKTLSYRFAGKYYLNRWPSQKAMKKVRERLKGIIHRGRNGVKGVRELVPEINRVLIGWREYFRSGNASAQFGKVENYLWNKLSRFECKRRKRKAPYRSPVYDRKWYQSLGIVSLIGTIRYRKPSLVMATANA